MSEKFVPWPTGDDHSEKIPKKEEPVIHEKADKDSVTPWPTPAEGIQQIRTLALGNTILEKTKAEHARTQNTWYACLRSSIVTLYGNIQLDDEVIKTLGEKRVQEILAELVKIDGDLERLKLEYPTREHDVPADKFQTVTDIAERIQQLYKKAAA